MTRPVHLGPSRKVVKSCDAVLGCGPLSLRGTKIDQWHSCGVCAPLPAKKRNLERLYDALWGIYQYLSEFGVQ